MGLRRCDRCGKHLAATAVFHRYRLVLQADQDLEALLKAPPAEDAASLAERMAQEGDWERYAEDVYQELAGVLCGACRQALVGALRPARGNGGA